MRFFSTLAGLAVAAALFTGCSGDSNAPDNSHVGHYAMVSVDGDPLPITVEDSPGFAVTLLSGDLVLNANKTFVQSLTLAFTVFGDTEPPETLSCDGRYQRRGNTLTLTTTASDNCEAGTVTATLSDNQVTVAAEGSEIIFRR